MKRWRPRLFRRHLEIEWWGRAYQHDPWRFERANTGIFIDLGCLTIDWVYVPAQREEYR